MEPEFIAVTDGVIVASDKNYFRCKVRAEQEQENFVIYKKVENYL